ncbi:OmpA family protein [Bacteroides cellulosilyticus]|uniref:OmpA family protein n=1 Tax=Bacteroides cellulosilyticus TaxID=246787 RepID=UPI0035645FA7
MRKNILLILLLSSTIFSHAQDSLSIPQKVQPPIEEQSAKNNIKYITIKKSMYKKTDIPSIQEEHQQMVLHNREYQHEISSNWFLNIAGGVSTLIGKPLGCEDLFGRTRPIFHASIGKWFSPTAGGRIAFQGFDLKSHLIEKQSYYHIHADFLWNMTNLFFRDKETRWQFIPFAGTGIIQNNTTHKHPFTLNYGILNHIRLHDRISLSLECGGLTTFADFDGAGKGNKFADHLFHLSAGLSFRFGKKGWKHTPNNLHDNFHITTLNKLKQLEKENELNNSIIAQMHKILEIEGLLSRLQDELAKSNLLLASDSILSINSISYYPVNNYSGLNSLRKRLSARTPPNNNYENLNEETFFTDYPNNELSALDTDSFINREDSLTNHPTKEMLSNNRTYLNLLANQEACVGSPILFFFHISTSNLTDDSQLANLDEIAKICRKYNLQLKVTGFADSNTGNATNNAKLSSERAEYIASELKKRGITDHSITLESRGGVDIYSPDKVNRCTKIEIYLK